MFPGWDSNSQGEKMKKFNVTTKTTRDRFYTHYEVTGDAAECNAWFENLKCNFPVGGYGTQLVTVVQQEDDRLHLIAKRYNNCD